LARRRFLPNEEKVRSTTQRRGKTTKPLCRRSAWRSPCAAAAPLPPQPQLAKRCSRRRPRRVRAKGSAGVSCRGPARPVAVLDRGGVNDDSHRQPFAVDQGVDLAALHLLAGVITHLVVSTALFSADLTDWLSGTPAEGCLPPHPLAQCHTQLGPDRLPDAIPQIARITVALPPINPTVRPRPHRCSSSTEVP
jgi:hypothetical protein